MPKNYNFDLDKNKSKTFQRIITIIQPGIPGIDNPPKPPFNGKITETIYTTPPASTVTETTTRPAHTAYTEITEEPRTEVTTVTHPTRYVTETSTLPAGKETVTVVTPPKTVTKTVTPAPITTTGTTTVSGKPSTYTTTTQPPATVVETTEPGEPQTVTTTVTAETKTVTKEPTTAVETITTTPVRQTRVAVPGTTEVVTRTVTPAPSSVSVTEFVNENYYREKLYERIHEVNEYYYFAGFAKDEKSKEIELPDRIGSSWTYEIVKGGDIVIVERTEDGKLVITPRPDFEGEGDVELLITDSEGNQYIYRVHVSDKVNEGSLINRTVNNYFYTINPGESERVIVNDASNVKDFYLVDEDGNRIEPKPGTIELVEDENKITVKVLDKDYSDTVTVRVEDNNGNQRDNIVVVETTNTKFDVTREILNTSTAIIERRGGDYDITSGEELIESIEQNKDGDSWIIKPKKDAEGDVTIVFTDDNGVKYNYTLKIKEDNNNGPVIGNLDLETRNSGTNDKGEIERRDGWNLEFVEGEDLVDVTEGTGKDGKKVWLFTPNEKGKNGGKVVVHVKDADGVLVGVWTLNIEYRDELADLEVQERARDVKDRTKVELYRGFEGTPAENGNDATPGNRFVLKSGEHLIDEDASEMPEDGNWKLRFKQGASDDVVVLEQQPVVKADGTIDYVNITEYTYHVTPGEVREMTYNFTSDKQVTLSGVNLTVKDADKDEVKNLFAGDEVPTSKNGRLKLDFKRDAKGTIVVENRTEDGYLYEVYTLNITPELPNGVTPITRNMTWVDTARAPLNDDDQFKVVEGEDVVNVEKKDGELVITGKEKAGKAVIEVFDARGTWARYELTIGEPEVKERVYEVSTNASFTATMVDNEKRFMVIEGASNFEQPEEKNGQWILRPKADAVGKTGVVLEYDADGNEINRYKILITEGAQTGVRQYTDFLVEKQPKSYEGINPEHTFKVVSGSEFADVKSENGKLEITAKPGSARNKVRVNEFDSEGKVVREFTFTIFPEGVLSAEGNTIGENRDIPVVINNGTVGGPINITFPEGAKGMALTEGSDLVEVVFTEEGAILTPKPGTKGGEVKFVLIGNDGQAWTEQKVNVTVELQDNGGTRVEQQGSSAELDGKCIAGIVGLTAPLLLAIPLGILSQVQIPGLEGVSAQINAAVRDANDRIQRGLGIYDEDRAQRAAGIQGAFSIENPQMIGMAAGALGAISLGLLAVDGVMRACGAEEYTSSYMIGKATGSETLMNGSSGKSDNKDNKSTDKAEGEGKAEDSSNKEK